MKQFDLHFEYKENPERFELVGGGVSALVTLGNSVGIKPELLLMTAVQDTLVKMLNTGVNLIRLGTLMEAQKAQSEDESDAEET